jgi:excisionase family DNA binding protein
MYRSASHRELAMNEATQHSTTAEAVTPKTVALAYLRAHQVLELLPISRRCLGNWQRRRVIPFYRIGRTVMFKRTDVEAALERFRVSEIGDKAITPRKRHIARKGDGA